VWKKPWNPGGVIRNFHTHLDLNLGRELAGVYGFYRKFFKNFTFLTATRPNSLPASLRVISHKMFDATGFPGNSKKTIGGTVS
jgi:hypothetical protein